MSIEIKFIDEEGRERRASPARDVAFFWPQLIDLAVEGMTPDRLEPWLKAYLDAQGVSQDQLGDALVAYYTFCEMALRPELAHPRDALKASGFLDCRPAAQLAVCAKLGQLVTGAFWAGIRSSTPEGKVPPSIEYLRVWARDVAAELRKPPPGSWPLARFWAWITGAKP